MYDTDQTPLAEAVLGLEGSFPYAVVYTDVEDLNPVPGPAQVGSGETRILSLVVEIGVASALRVPKPDGKDDIVIQFAATDAGMELAIDFIETQILDALWRDGASEWGDLFKTMIERPKRYTTRRGGQAERGLRWAARRLQFQCTTMHEPPPGWGIEKLPYAQKFIQMAQDNPQLGIAEIAEVVKNYLESSHLPEWRTIQGMLGVTRAGAEALVVPGLPAFPELSEGGLVIESPAVITSLEDIASDIAMQSELFPVDPSWIGLEPKPYGPPFPEDNPT